MNNAYAVFLDASFQRMKNNTSDKIAHVRKIPNGLSVTMRVAAARDITKKGATTRSA